MGGLIIVWWRRVKGKLSLVGENFTKLVSNSVVVLHRLLESDESLFVSGLETR